MVIDKKFLEDMILASKREQDSLRLNHAKQEGVIAFCEMLIKKLEAEEMK